MSAANTPNSSRFVASRQLVNRNPNTTETSIKRIPQTMKFSGTRQKLYSVARCVSGTILLFSTLIIGQYAPTQISNTTKLAASVVKLDASPADRRCVAVDIAKSTAAIFTTENRRSLRRIWNKQAPIMQPVIRSAKIRPKGCDLASGLSAITAGVQRKTKTNILDSKKLQSRMMHWILRSASKALKASRREELDAAGNAEVVVASCSGRAAP
mmetsp:Transcript_9311/g.22883  ORF Transcript_9311/g.22883 Transcript_9311/m.22883 type:complete len:212 (-) Transcript_9311:1563-2198(-)